VEKFFPEIAGRFAQLLPLLAGRKLAIVGHARPDGDCIGSQIALARVLRALGHEVICINPDVVPRRLQFLVDDIIFARPDTVESVDYTAIYSKKREPVSRSRSPASTTIFRTPVLRRIILSTLRQLQPAKFWPAYFWTTTSPLMR
jgi:hypothetical protein